MQKQNRKNQQESNNKHNILPISYFIIIPVCFLCFNSHLASLFYPIVVLTSVIGSISLCVALISETFNTFLHNNYSSNLSKRMKNSYYEKVWYLFIIFTKLTILYNFPKNISTSAFIVSSDFLLLYFFFIIICV